MMMAMVAGRVAADGTFTLANVAPGDHVIDVRPPGRGPGSAAEFASVPVTVANENISGVRITTGTGATVKGRVLFEGTAPRTGGFGPLRVFAQAEDPQMPMMGMMGAPPSATEPCRTSERSSSEGYPARSCSGSTHRRHGRSSR